MVKHICNYSTQIPLECDIYMDFDLIKGFLRFVSVLKTNNFHLNAVLDLFFDKRGNKIVVDTDGWTMPYTVHYDSVRAELLVIVLVDRSDKYLYMNTEMCAVLISPEEISFSLMH